MITLYAIALIGVCLVMLGMLVDAVLSVSRKPTWEVRRAALPTVELVEVTDRRTQQLPFVGVGRRRADSAEASQRSEDRHSA